MSDIISSPDHYCKGRKYEPRKVIHDWGLNFNLGNAVKYISRAGRKNDILEDLMKARQYLDFEIEELEADTGMYSNNRTGHWILHDIDGSYECSNCHHIWKDFDQDTHLFCPSCGFDNSYGLFTEAEEEADQEEQRIF